MTSPLQPVTEANNRTQEDRTRGTKNWGEMGESYMIKENLITSGVNNEV